MQDEFTAEMHKEFTISEEAETCIKVKATLNMQDRMKIDLQEAAKMYNVSLESCMRYRYSYFNLCSDEDIKRRLKYSDIDVWFDFTSDTVDYWDGFWQGNDGLGGSKYDPDSKSGAMQLFHRLLWNKELPNGEKMNLQYSIRKYLTWKGIRFGSDSITSTFRYYKMKPIIEEVAKDMDDYKGFVESTLRKLYTIGGEIILPTSGHSINTARGFHPRIKDRWDLTLECIRRFYINEESPLTKVLNDPVNKSFFSLFVDFKGFVDFFFLQDCVSEDYSKVILKYDSPLFETYPLPKTKQEYLDYINKELEFVAKRNNRIQNYLKQLEAESPI